MPIVGAIVGLGTNWLAIQMIFRPLEPRRYFGLVTYQGMFPKRQAEIAHDYGRIAGHEVLTPANLIDHVSTNPAAGELAAELVGQARGPLDQFRPMLRSEHTSELQSLMRIPYAVFCLKKKKQKSSNK